MLVLGLIVIATWYLTQAVTLTKGPFNIFSWARSKQRWHGGLLECHVCFGLWAALFFTWVALPGASIRQIVLDGVAAAGIFVILWDGSIFAKAVIESWLYAIQMAAQPHVNEIAQLDEKLQALTLQFEAIKRQVDPLASDMETVKNAIQHLDPVIAALQENGCEPLESRADQSG